MSEKEKKVIGSSDFSELRALLKSYDTDKEAAAIEFGSGEIVETELFSLVVPTGYTADRELGDFDLACYYQDFQTTPLQITLRSEPLVLLSPAEHREELKNSILNTKGMVMREIERSDGVVYRFDIPTLGGKQMFFPLYHETEVFTLRINFVGRIINAEEIAGKILASFRFKDFQPRFSSRAVDSLVNVFNYNRDKLKEVLAESRGKLQSASEAEDLSESYTQALCGCFNVFAGEMEKILVWDISDEDIERLLALGESFCADLETAIDYKGTSFSSDRGGEIRTIVDAWRR